MEGGTAIIRDDHCKINLKVMLRNGARLHDGWFRLSKKGHKEE
jgi:hypothetical protein